MIHRIFPSASLLQARCSRCLLLRMHRCGGNVRSAPTRVFRRIISYEGPILTLRGLIDTLDEELGRPAAGGEPLDINSFDQDARHEVKSLPCSYFLVATASTDHSTAERSKRSFPRAECFTPYHLLRRCRMMVFQLLRLPGPSGRPDTITDKRKTWTLVKSSNTFTARLTWRLNN